MAWRHHYKNNPHHWQYWIDPYDGAEEIPVKYLKQMIADWEGMALKFGDSAQQYYLNNYKKIELAHDTRLNLESMLGLNDSMICNYGHTLEEFADMYGESTYNSYFGWIQDKYGVDTYKILKQ